MVQNFIAAIAVEAKTSPSRLPLPYFEHRPTGVVVARLHGVETIREFVSGAAVTLLLDLPFLFIFLAVMFFFWVRLPGFRRLSRLCAPKAT